MKQYKKLLALLLSVCMLASLMLTACGGEDPGSGSGSADPIKIGLLTEVSGAYEGWGNQELQGFMCGLHYATDGTMEIDGRPIQVIVEDTTGDVGVGVQKATKLIEDDKVDVLSGSCISSIALAVMAKAAELETPYVINVAASDDITGANFNEYTFRVGRTMSMATNVSFEYLEQTVGVEGTTWVLISPDYAGGRDGSEALGRSIEELGGTVLEYIYAPMDCADFTPYIQTIKNLNPQYLSATLVGNNYTAKLPQQLREMGALENTTMSVSMVDFDFLAALGENGIGMEGECIYHYNLYDNEVNQAYIDIHKQLYDGEYPDYMSAEGFAGAQAIVEAIKKGGSTETDKFIAAMEGLEFESYKGTMIIRPEDHQALQAHAVGRIVSDGQGGTTIELAYLADLEAMTVPVTAPGR